MHYNVKKKQDSSIPSDIDITIKNDELLTPIDILSIDKYSRLTLTKRVKEILSLNPEDKIIVYQQTYNKNMILKVQHKEKVSDTWILKRNKSHLYDIEIKTNIFNKKEEDKDRYNLKYDENTLYNTPILLVDDEPDLLITFSFFLKNEGYKNVKTFSDSLKVLQHISNFKNPLYYNLAILDIRMPKINGIQLYQILKILYPSIKIIFLTALDAVNELTSIYPDVKSEDIMKKPIDKDKFIQIVNDKTSTLLGASIIFFTSLFVKIIQDFSSI